MGGDPGSDGPAGGPSGVGQVRGATSAATAFPGDGEWSGVPPHHGGGPGPGQGCPERPRRLLLPGPASDASARAQSLAAGKSAAGVGKRDSEVRGLAPEPPACGRGRLPSCCFWTCLFRKRRFPHPQFLLSRLERGALPPAVGQPLHPSLTPTGSPVTTWAPERVARVQEMRRKA